MLGHGPISSSPISSLLNWWRGILTATIRFTVPPRTIRFTPPARTQRFTVPARTIRFRSGGGT